MQSSPRSHQSANAFGAVLVFDPPSPVHPARIAKLLATQCAAVPQLMRSARSTFGCPLARPKQWPKQRIQTSPPNTTSTPTGCPPRHVRATYPARSRRSLAQTVASRTPTVATVRDLRGGLRPPRSADENCTTPDPMEPALSRSPGRCWTS